jgi:hypothetical protein
MWAVAYLAPSLNPPLPPGHARVYLVVASKETGLNPAILSADIETNGNSHTRVVWSDLCISSAECIEVSSLQVNR